MRSPARALLLGALAALPASAVVLRDGNPGEEVELMRSWLGVDSSGHTNASTVIFIAGIEGSGHHFIHQLTDAAIFSHRAPIVRVAMPKAWPCGGEWLESGIADLQTTLSKAPKGGIYLLEDIRSYPECGIFKGWVERDDRKNTYHPHLQWIEQAVKGAGARLKVILLQRDMEDCLAADCIHRHIDNCETQADALKQNSLRLASDLTKIDHNSISCFEYGKMDTMIAAVKDAFGGAVPEELIQKMWKSSPGEEDMRLFQKRWFANVDKLQLGGGALRGLCKSSRKVDTKNLAHLFGGTLLEDGSVALQRQT